jgi:integrase/recombinase XerD
MKKELSQFIEYLKEKQYKKSTIEDFKRNLGLFISYIEIKGLDLESCTYTHLLDWMKELRNEGKTPKNINRKLTVVRQFFDYLLQNQSFNIQNSKFSIPQNPARHLHIKGQKRHQPQGLLSKEQLEAMYQDCPEKTMIQQRNKLIISLYINQALRLSEIERLEIHHLNLKEGTIYIPKNSTTNRRTLALEARQILPINEYLNHIRPELLKQANEATEKLFFGIGKAQSLKQSLTETLIQLRKKHSELKNFLQIRSSVIALWASSGNIREVQYKAGHYYLSTTESYKQTHIKDLKAAIEKYHPTK